MTENKRSESIATLAAALALAQGQIKPAARDAKGAYSHYSTLEAVWDVCRGPLSENGLSVIQMPETKEGELSLETILCHSSGEWISSTIILPVVAGRMNEHQALGSAITYARRYSMASMVGVASGDDDDAQMAEKVESLRKGEKTSKEWRPTKGEFFGKAVKEFPDLGVDDIADELKELGFPEYDVNKAKEMMDALKTRRNKNAS